MVNIMDLKEIKLFKNLDDQTLSFLESRIRKKHYKKDAVIFYANDIPKKLLILTSGEAQIYKSDEKGNEMIIGIFKPTSLLAEMPTLEQMPYPATAKAITEVIIYEIELEIIMQYISERSPLALVFIDSLTKKIKRLDSLLKYLSISNATLRVVTFLYDNMDNLEYITQRQIASNLRLTPEGLSRILKKLKDEDIITVESKKLKIIDIKKLELMIG
jgi:CRP/FNR family transcriptional regulator